MLVVICLTRILYGVEDWAVVRVTARNTARNETPFESEVHAKRPSPVNSLNNFCCILVRPFFSARELRAYAYLTL